jgi:hypothetical protein
MKNNAPMYLDSSLNIYASFHQRQESILLAASSFICSKVQMLEGTLGKSIILNEERHFNSCNVMATHRKTEMRGRIITKFLKFCNVVPS